MSRHVGPVGADRELGRALRAKGASTVRSDEESVQERRPAPQFEHEPPAPLSALMAALHPVAVDVAALRLRARRVDRGREPATDDGELERRVDQAPAVARASESAALEIGRRRSTPPSSAVGGRAGERVGCGAARKRGADLLAERPDKAANGAADQGDEVLRRFTERADRQSLVLPSWNGRRPLS